jgi:hypothetical protein
MELYKNIKEIVELADEELIKNNKETYATLDYEDLVELKDMYNHIIEFYNGETYTANQLKNIEKDRNKYYIHKDKIKAKIKDLENLNSKFSQRVIKAKELYLTELVQNILKELLEEE